ncbi:hypothetical protein [Nocardia iowensis]|uniref:Uncharacterized protein n=1 Tax=Nocardia iowensis TaxID=204891 RepID=A0ABX8RGK9_NOCIO|nr:hypothetical protein [Nocardia iowensis]QXN88476.1 hypothetical protein KV110_23035 [Nocardia iowensis]
MVTIRNYRHAALIVTVFGAMGFAVVSAAAPTLAANTIDATAIGPANVAIDYSCEASAGVAAIRVMVGEPDAESPSATGTQNEITCDGTNQSTVVMLDGEPVSAGQRVQVRVALVDREETVIAGQAKAVSLG